MAKKGSKSSKGKGPSKPKGPKKEGAAPNSKVRAGRAAGLEAPALPVCLCVWHLWHLWQLLSRVAAWAGLWDGRSQRASRLYSGAQDEVYLEEMAALAPQDRITAVRPFWESLTQVRRSAAQRSRVQPTRAVPMQLWTSVAEPELRPVDK